eukprot:118352-Prymnesium_polylepis.1
MGALTVSRIHGTQHDDVTLAGRRDDERRRDTFGVERTDLDAAHLQRLLKLVLLARLGARRGVVAHITRDDCGTAVGACWRRVRIRRDRPVRTRNAVVCTAVPRARGVCGGCVRAHVSARREGERAAAAAAQSRAREGR